MLHSEDSEDSEDLKEQSRFDHSSIYQITTNLKLTYWLKYFINALRNSWPAHSCNCSCLYIVVKSHTPLFVASLGMPAEGNCDG